MNDAQMFREITRVLVRKMGLLQKTDAACCGITLGQCHSIIEIGRQRETSVNELAALLNLDKSTTSRLVDGLVHATIVHREVDPEDRRSTRIRLTSYGEGIYKQLNDTMNTYFEGVLQLIPPEKRELFQSIAPYLLEAINRSGNCCDKIMLSGCEDASSNREE